MTRTLAALAAALIATGARAQTPPAAPPSDAPPAAAPAPAAPAPKKEEAKPKGTFAIGPKSQIIIQGRAWLEVNNVRADKGIGTVPVHNISRVSTNSSYLRVRGERELAYGFKGIAQIEAEVGMDGSGALGTPFTSTRNTFVGLSSPYGELSLGKFDSPSKETTIGRDPFGGTGIFGYYNVFTLYRADRRMNNAIMYETPSFQGLSGMVAYSMGEAVYTSVGGPLTNPWMLNAAVHYKNGPLFVGVAYEYRNDCANPDKEPTVDASCSTASLGSAARPSGYDQNIRVGADYTVKETFTKVAFVYDRVMLELAKTAAAPELTLNRDAYWGSITQGLGTNKHQLILNYGAAGKYSGKNQPSSVTDKTGAQTFTAAYRYNFDSDLMLYAAVVQIINEDNQTQKIGSGGVPAVAVGGSWAAPKGSTVTGFGAGIRYMF